MQNPIKVTTEYTLLSSLITLDKLLFELKENNVKTCGICDTNLFGAYLFYKKCVENNIKPLIGLEILINDKKMYLYAKNFDGYQDLLKISFIKEEREINFIDIHRYSNNLIILIPYESREFSKEFKDDDMYVTYCNLDEKKNILLTDYKYLYLDDIKVFTNKDSIYLNYLTLIKDGKTKTELSKKSFCSLDEYINGKNDLDSEAEFIAKINIEFPRKPNHLPKYESSIENYKLLTSLCLKGLKKRLLNMVTDEYTKRLDYELKVINDMGFVDYFLIVYDYVLYAKKHDIGVGPGRGSAAGSLVSFCLGITDVDPLKYNLLFERFLNPERVTMPDIDIDFEDEKRSLVIDYVKSKYTSNKVGLIITFGTLGSKQVLRDVARVLEINSDAFSRLMKYIDSEKDLKENYKGEAKEIIDNNKDLQTLFKISSKLYGLKRHTSIHAAGVVISKEDLKDIVPVQKVGEDLVIGLTMDQLEENGLLKMDFLALKNLTTINEIVKTINQTEKLDLKNISLEDKKTYELLTSGNTKGIFQFETSGMQNLLQKLKPTSFSDLVAAVALFRPGPMDNIDIYIKNKNNPEQIRYIHESLRPILKETYGIIIYQEQIMQILEVMAGYSYGEADVIRRAMSKKKEDVILKEKDNFINNAIKKGYTKEISEKVYDLILKFANYGFNKAHSVSYSLIGYKMAYLKANYPDKFILSNLNIFGKSQIKAKEYLNEALKYHLKLHKPLINESSSSFISKGLNILLPFTQIVGISEEFSNEIVNARENNPFESIFDFVRRVPLKYINKMNLEKLIKADVFRKFSYNQKTLINNIDEIINYAEIASGLDKNEISEPYLIIDKDYDVKEKRLIEKETYGFYVSNHPSSQYQERVVKTEKINAYFDKDVKMVLLIDDIRTFKTKKDENMASITASDETGEIELVIFPRSYNLINDLSVGDIILVNGRVSKRYSDYQIIVNQVKRKVNEN